MGISMKAARIDAGLTQEEAGKLINKSKQAIAAYESGRVDITAKDLKTLCEAYHKDIGDILLPFELTLR